MDVVVIGAGPAGLAAALGLARRGHKVTVLERDPAPGPGGIDDAFTGWQRKGVPQSRQGHFILGKAVGALQDNAPDVIEALAAEGIVAPPSPLTLLIPPDELEPGDDLGIIPTRRIPFELTLRRVVEAERSVTIRSGIRVDALLVENGSTAPRVRGVRLDGEEIAADVVVDAGGRRSRLHSWLREHGAPIPPSDEQATGLTYYGRYFRARGDAPDPWALLSCMGELDAFSYVVFPGDNGTYGVCFFAPSDDRELRALRDAEVWNLAAAQFPAIAQWTSEEFAEGLIPVDVTVGHDNVLRRFLDDGVPAYLGALPVGDALCTTDPSLAWGVSLGLATGFAAADAISDHAGDPGDAALAYAAAVMPDLEQCFRAASTRSRVVSRRWRGEFTVPLDIDEEREYLFNFALSHVFEEPAILRGAFRRVNLVDPPSAVFEDERFMQAVRRMQDKYEGAEAPDFGPERDELVEILAASREKVGRVG